MASVEREELTAEERAYLRKAMSHPSVLKALRIIDAHAADRAVLVAQLEAALSARDGFSGEASRQRDRAEAAVAQVAELTRERDALRDSQEPSSITVEYWMRRAKESESAWAAKQAELDAAKAEVTRLTRERDEARATNLTWLAKYNAQRGELAGVRDEVTRLTEALAAAERREKAANLDVARDQLAAASALLMRIPECLLTDCPVYAELVEYKRVHLAAQPATAPDRDETEQAVLDAMAAVPVCTLLQCSAMNGTIRGISTSLAEAGTAELARRESKRG